MHNIYWDICIMGYLLVSVKWIHAKEGSWYQAKLLSLIYKAQQKCEIIGNLSGICNEKQVIIIYPYWLKQIHIVYL